MSITLPVSYYLKGETSSPRFAAAFAAGCGGQTADGTALLPGPVAGFFTPPLWPILRQAKDEGRDWYYGDHGYFKSGGHYYRVTKNAYQYSAPSKGSSVGRARFRALRLPISPWRKKGRHILVCPQSADYFQLLGLSESAWIEDVLGQLSQYSDRPVLVRRRQPRPIEKDLVNAWAVVVYSSASALNALRFGVPVFVLADFACAYRMGVPDLSKIETPYYPYDRDHFFALLAENQWTLAEITNGTAWRALSEHA
jgi:hypothetical protein